MAMTSEKAARKAKALKKAKRHDQRGKDHPDAVAKADAIIKRVKEATAEEHALGKKVKELRDGGMAWWQIAYEMNLPGSGPNVAQGKSGAARARALYKKTFGELPGDVAKRSTKAERAAAGADGAVIVRKQIFPDDLLLAEFENDYALAEANEEILAKVSGHEIRWIGKTQCSDGSVLSTEREARVHPDNIRIERREGGRTILHFREYEKGDRRAQQWRAVHLADVYDIRR